jgi:hypothetical protein
MGGQTVGPPSAQTSPLSNVSKNQITCGCTCGPPFRWPVPGRDRPGTASETADPSARLVANRATSGQYQATAGYSCQQTPYPRPSRRSRNLTCISPNRSGLRVWLAGLRS